MSRNCARVLDFGQSARQYKRLFTSQQYETCDIDESSAPDIVADICSLHMIADGHYDGVICCSILEHVYDPFKAMCEIRRILADGGSLFGYVPFLANYHPFPGHYDDYYRFTQKGVLYLLKDFRAVETVPVRGNVTSIIHNLPCPLHRLKVLLYWADRFFSNKQVNGHYFSAAK